MDENISKKKIILLMSAGIIGCLLMGGSDWLMIYGDMSFSGSLAWLTEGVKNIPPWRNSLALALSFPAVIFYGAALFGINYLIFSKKHRKIYSAFTAAGFTPWIAIHLFYVMILYLFAWMWEKAEPEFIYETCENLFRNFAWLIPVGEVIMLLPFIYIFILFVTKKTLMPRLMALNNPLIIYVLLKILTSFMPDVPAKLAFINGLMSESMLIWFIVLIIALACTDKKKKSA